MKALFPRCSRRRVPAAAMPNRAVQREYRGGPRQENRAENVGPATKEELCIDSQTSAFKAIRQGTG